VRTAAARAHDRNAIELVMVEKCRQILCDEADASAREAGRAAVTGSVGEQVTHAEIALDRGIGVPIEPASWGSL
jgi:hypothetical protein